MKFLQHKPKKTQNKNNDKNIGFLQDLSCSSGLAGAWNRAHYEGLLYAVMEGLETVPPEGLIWRRTSFVACAGLQGFLVPKLETTLFLWCLFRSHKTRSCGRGLFLLHLRSKTALIRSRILLVHGGPAVCFCCAELLEVGHN